MNNGSNLTLSALVLLAAASAARRRAKAGSSATTGNQGSNFGRSVPRSGPTLGDLKSIWIGEAAVTLSAQVQRTRPVWDQWDQESDDVTFYRYRIYDWYKRMFNEHLSGKLFWVNPRTGKTFNLHDKQNYFIPVRTNDPMLPVEYLRFMFETLARNNWWEHIPPKDQVVQYRSRICSGELDFPPRRFAITSEQIATLPISVMREEGHLDKLDPPVQGKLFLPTETQIDELIVRAGPRNLSDSVDHLVRFTFKLQIDIKAQNVDAPQDVIDRIGRDVVPKAIWSWNNQTRHFRFALKRHLQESFNWVKEIEFVGRNLDHLIIDVSRGFSADFWTVEWESMQTRRSLRGTRRIVPPETREQIAKIWNRTQVFLDEVAQLKKMVKDHVQDFVEEIRTDKDFWEEVVTRWQDFHGEEP